MPPTQTLEQTNQLDDVAFQSDVYKMIERELGMSALLRFIRLTHPKSGNYTEDRHQWLDGVSLEEFLAEVKSQEASH